MKRLLTASSATIPAVAWAIANSHINAFLAPENAIIGGIASIFVVLCIGINILAQAYKTYKEGQNIGKDKDDDTSDDHSN